jgi:hypothetical protein
MGLVRPLPPVTMTISEPIVRRFENAGSIHEKLDAVLAHMIQRTYGPSKKLELYRCKQRSSELRRKAFKAKRRALTTQEEIDFARRRAMIIRLAFDW